jgi:hypothetical protein
MVAGNQTDSGRSFRYRCTPDPHPLLPARRRGDPTGIYKKWRQTDSPTPYGGESLGAIGRTPRSAGTKSEEDRWPLDPVSSGAGLETWR